MPKLKQAYCHWSKSLGELESTAFQVWGTPPYNCWKNRKDNLIQFGCYDVRDYIKLFLHRGKRFILWAGSDILNLKNNFLFNNGKFRTISKIFSGFPRFLDGWLDKHCENWVENETEKQALESLGIKVTGVCPSYLDIVNNYEMNYEWDKTMKVYLSTNEGREREYGFTTVLNVAYALPDVEFHLYGSNSWKEWWGLYAYKQKGRENIVMHGRVSKEQMNEEIKKMQVGLRLNEFDGFSEILAKSVLWGQYQIGKVKHPMIPSFKNDRELVAELKKIQGYKEHNFETRNYYLYTLNNFPWNMKKLQR